MPIHAYPETYLSSMQSAMGDAFDYAVNICGINGDIFTKLFVTAVICKRIENGEPGCLAGKSGIEIVHDILNETTGHVPDNKMPERLTRSVQYWIGWAVAYYQWYSGRKYSEIFHALPYEDLAKLYDTLHEADIGKFTDIADARVREYFPATNLKRIRNTYGCTQVDLAKHSGVGLRSIQMYEQRNKDINKASADTLLRLSRALGCTMEDLMEQ